MTYVQRLLAIESNDSGNPSPVPARLPLVLIIEDDDFIASALQPICDFLEIGVERVPSECDVTDILNNSRPMGVVAQMDGQGQDGCHIMKTIAQHDRTLPILLIVGDDPVLAGAADAVEEVWQLESVVKVVRLPGIGAIVDFLFRAGRKGRCLRLVPV